MHLLTVFVLFFGEMNFTKQNALVTLAASVHSLDSTVQGPFLGDYSGEPQSNRI